MSDKAPGTITLGIDLGTSAVKIVALSPAREELATGSAAFATRSDVPEQAEQDPADWLLALAAAAADLRWRLDGRCGKDWTRAVGAIGLTGQLPTLVCLGERGPLGPAITWKDARADAWAASHISAAQRQTLYARTGMPIDGRYLGPMYACHWHGLRPPVRTILSAKDYLAFVLTGARVTDRSTAAGYGAYEFAPAAFSAELAALWQLPLTALPAVRPADSAAGTLNDAGARLLELPLGVPVTVGAADSVCSAYAMTGLGTGRVCITMGSSTVIVDAVSEPRLDAAARYLLTPHVTNGWYGREMDLLATGTGYRWLNALFGWAPGQLDRQAAGSVPGARGLVFAPYLAGGEQGALWNPRLRGTIHGLTVQHGPSDIARAFLEGIYFEMRRCVEVLAETQPIDTIVVSGQIVEQATSLGLLADVLGQPVHPFPGRSPAARGAALLARPLAGLDSDPAAAPMRPAAVAPGDERDAYEALYAAYLREVAMFARCLPA
jgi:xylulokinase